MSYLICYGHIAPRWEGPQEKPIFLWRIEVVIPLETSFLTMRIDQFDNTNNVQLLSNSLDLVEERREVATIRLTQYQQKLRQWYEKGIKIRTFLRGDLVLRRVIGNMKNLAWRKRRPNWKGPYWVTSVIRVRAFHLEDLVEIPVP